MEENIHNIYQTNLCPEYTNNPMTSQVLDTHLVT